MFLRKIADGKEQNRAISQIAYVISQAAHFPLHNTGFCIGNLAQGPNTSS